MYKLNIGEALPSIINAYKFELIFMSGDGDVYETIVCTINKDDEYLQRFTDFIHLCLRKYELNQIPDDKQMFVENCLKKEAFKDDDELQSFFERNLIFWWPGDKFSDDDYASFDKITITYFDNNGIEHAVNVNHE